jgi:DNA-directed RNA polymerase subunit RPC12/RpoP
MVDIKKYKMNCPYCGVKPIPGKWNWRNFKYVFRTKKIEKRMNIGCIMVSTTKQLNWERTQEDVAYFDECKYCGTIVS